MKKIPILVLAFNRPDYVIKALEPIMVYQPERLYLACDGPRDEKSGESRLVEATQKVMLDSVDWPCDIKTLFRKANLGCARAVYKAITWFFEHEEYGIIIEDDVIVGQDFFKLCEDLLPCYRDFNNVMQISAMNFSNLSTSNTYTFQKKPFVWGWATWKRAWEKMDMEMKEWPSFKMKSLLNDYGWFQTLMMWRSWRTTYNNIAKSTLWATRWHFSVISNDGICICSKANLVVNIGFVEGTHYSDNTINPYSYLRIGSLLFPIIHPSKIEMDRNQLRIDNNDFTRIKILGARKKFKEWIRSHF